MQFIETLVELDKQILIFINSGFSNSFFNWFFPLITDLHKSPGFIITFYAIYLALFFKNYKLKQSIILIGFLLLTVGATDFTGTTFFKKPIERLRPGDAGIRPLEIRSPYGGYSFISNHAANTASFANYCSYWLPQTRIYSFVIVVLVSYSRIYNGVHFPSDILGGWIWGFLVSTFFIQLGKRLLKTDR